MDFINSVLIAFAMFSRVPVPRADWNERNMRYLMAAFPLVGAAAGAAAFGWGSLAGWLDFGPFLRGAGFVLVTAVLSGGIHLDGFCDTVDALSSRADRGKKLEILEDAHIGAFAAIACGLYLLVYAALASELDHTFDSMLCFSLTFVFSRCLSGLSVLFFPCAKDSGLARAFSGAASRKAGGVILSAVLLCCGASLVLSGGIKGLFAIAGALVVMAVYHRVAMREFGGVTGDTAGWFLQICEAVMLCGIILAQKL